MGSATRTLKQSGNNWTYVSQPKLVRMASATETSRFSLNGTKLIQTALAVPAKFWCTTTP